VDDPLYTNVFVSQFTTPFCPPEHIAMAALEYPEVLPHPELSYIAEGIDADPIQFTPLNKKHDDD
jgi:hypothetical protein